MTGSLEGPPPTTARRHKLGLVTVVLLFGTGAALGTVLLLRDDDSSDKNRDDRLQEVARQVEEAYVDVDLLVRSADQTGSDVGDAALLDASLLDLIRALEGVELAEPMIETTARMIGPDGTPLSPLPVVSNWIAEERLNPYTITEGRPPSAPDEVVIDRRSAHQADLNVGDTILIQLREVPEPATFVVAGIATLGSLDNVCGERFALLSADAAQLQLVPAPDVFTGVLAAVSPGVTTLEVAERLEAALADGGDGGDGGDDIEALTHEALVADRLQHCE